MYMYTHRERERERERGGPTEVRTLYGNTAEWHVHTCCLDSDGLGLHTLSGNVITTEKCCFTLTPLYPSLSLYPSHPPLCPPLTTLFASPKVAHARAKPEDKTEQEMRAVVRS